MAGVVIPVTGSDGNPYSAPTVQPGTPGSPTTDLVGVQGTDAGGIPVISSGVTKNLTCGITRPNTTPTYAPGQNISDNSAAPMFISNIARINAGTGIIKTCNFYMSDNPGSKPDIDLLIFNTSVTINLGTDAATAALTATQIGAWLGTIELLGANAKVVNGILIYQIETFLRYVCSAGTKNLLGYPIARNAWTPAAGSALLRWNFGILND